MNPRDSQSWLVFADALLGRAAIMHGAGGKRADPLAGLRVAPADAVQLVAELTGAESGDRGLERASRKLADELAAMANAAFADMLGANEPIGTIAVTAALSESEAAVLALACAVELDPRRQKLAGFVNDDVTQPWLTPHSIGLVLDVDGAALALGPGGGLRRGCLIELTGDRPWGGRAVRPAESVMCWLVGDESLGPDLPAELEQLPYAGEGSLRMAIAAGPDRIRRLQAITGELRATGFLLCPAEVTPAELDALTRRASLSGEAIVVEAGDTLPAAVRARIERAFHLPWAISSAHELTIDELPRRAWTELPVADAAASRDEIAGVFGDDTSAGTTLTASQLDAAATAHAGLHGTASQAVRRIAAGQIEHLATRLIPSRTFDDLVLEPYRLRLVRSVASRARHRDVVYGEWGFSPLPSTGVTALFAGPSGTGKTLAAEIIAGELGLDLYRIDLSQLVSKYIGETEKNLSQVFSAAEASPVVLFFDEADALLGKRSDVTDARDRYANIEVAYLLQRLERYNGVVVLATNLANNIDPAFLRRVHVAVEFPMPEAPERLRIWQRCIPDTAPTKDLDLPFLANKFEISGGSIANAATTGAFVAASAGTPLSMPALAVGVKRELQKLARLFRDEDFGPWAGQIAELE